MMSNLLIYFDMKKYLFPILLLLTCSSCIENAIDSRQVEEDRPLTLQSLLTKSGMEPVDSLVMLNKLQSDVDNLMMGRVVNKNGTFVLAISRESAGYYGVPDEVYDMYLEYV